MGLQGSSPLLPSYVAPVGVASDACCMRNMKMVFFWGLFQGCFKDDCRGIKLLGILGSESPGWCDEPERLAITCFPTEHVGVGCG